MKVVRPAAICGLAGTSNVAGGQRYGVPLSGTMAHSFVQAHLAEVTAFRDFEGLLGDRSVLLVDTYDTGRGVEHAIEVAHERRGRGLELRGIRLDSGDLALLARAARRRLDEEGFTDMQIFASGGLNEYDVEALVADDVPIDGFGVGSDLGVSADAPVLDSVYKLVVFAGRPVRKLSPGKATWPGAKQVWRRPDWSGDILSLADEPAPAVADPLLVEVMRDGVRNAAGRATLSDANEHFERRWSELPDEYRRLRDPLVHVLQPSPALLALTESMEAGA
jgi:nicotinate phosphoribosyltransferase